MGLKRFVGVAETLPVLVNREGGRAAKAGEGLRDILGAAFACCGGSADIRLIAAGGMPAAISAAARSHGRIVVAGGDGTMSCAAQALADRETELAILPLGTLNHLARDLAIPVDLDGAAAVAVHGRPTRIDLGSVNGHHFVNNVSLGLYPLMVTQRDAMCRKRHVPKWLATLPASWDALAHFPTLHLQVNLGAGEFPLATRLLFVGNNRYAVEGAAMGSRASLHSGRLWALAVPRRSRMALLVGAMRTLIGRSGDAGDFDDLGEMATFAATVGDGALTIALDGEVMQMSSPLRFESKPGALRLVVPASVASAAAAPPQIA